MFSNAVALTISEHGPLNQWLDDSKEFFEKELAKHLKVVKTCETSATKCGGGLTWDWLPAYVLNDGVAFNVGSRVANDPSSPYYKCSASVSEISKGAFLLHYYYCARIIVDINGLEQPNTPGIDTFEFRVYTDGVLPNGLVDSASTAEAFNECKNKQGKATQCTAWALKNENMDYLRCPEKLSWDGPKSCK